MTKNVCGDVFIAASLIKRKMPNKQNKLTA